MNKAIKKIVIVGGGTAGWISAAMLAKHHGQDKNSGLEITLIESDQIPTVGVGEGTFPTMRKTLMSIGISETELIRRCDATFKQGAKFVSWRKNDKNEFYYHPFNVPSGYGKFDLSAYWQKEANRKQYGRFAEAVDFQDQICEAGLAPKKIVTPEYQAVLNYAYHFDASKVANLIKEKAIELGVKHVVDKVLDVNIDSNGYITTLITEKNGQIEGDLFIDCSGFAGLLINKTMKIPFKSARKYLFNDFAIAAQIPYDEGEDIACHTIATGQKAGWTWDIGLSSRKGMGYVYSSAHTSHEEAINTFANHIGPKAKNLDFRRIPFDSGYREKFWHKNCVAIGLSAGFLEPLEASALILVDNSVEWLSERLPADFTAMNIIAKQFNSGFIKKWDAIIDFLKLHYALSERTDEPYWLDNIQKETLSERLQDLLELWKYHPPHINDTDAQFDVFPIASIQYVLYGLNFKTELSKQDYLYNNDKLAEKHFQQNLKMLDKIKCSLPNHRDFIEKIKLHGLQKI
jgi:tryptophan 7-halogenase